MELEKKLAAYEEDLLLFWNQAAELKSNILYTTGSNLVKALRKMVNNSECSDVTFICEDGDRIQASRMLLVARCPVLKSMLSNGMAESKQSEVVLSQVSSDVFLLVLKFLYTGQLWEEDLKFPAVVSEQHKTEDEHEDAFTERVNEFSPFSLDWSFVFKLTEAARFFLLDELEFGLMRRLWRDLPRNIFYSVEILEKVTEKLTTLCRFSANAELRGGVAGKTIDILGLYLVRIMSEHDLGVTHLCNLSYESMHFYLRYTQNICGNEIWSHSFREYVRLWQLTTWCIGSRIEANDEPGQEASTVCLVEPKRVGPVAIGSKRQREQVCQELSSHMSTEFRQKVAAMIERGDFEKLKTMINLRCIHPELLIHVVEPSGIFSSRELDSALRKQLLRASRWRRQIGSHDRKLQWLVVDVGSACLATDFSLPPSKLAIGNVAMWCDCIYEWEIVQIFKSKYHYRATFVLDVGFLSSDPEVLGNGQSSLSECKNGWALRIEGDELMYFACGRKISQGKLSQFRSPSTDRRQTGMCVYSVRLKLDRMEKTASFSFEPNGKEYKVVCEDLPTELLYPAAYVCYDGELWNSETRLELSRGFDFSENVKFDAPSVKKRRKVAVSVEKN